MKNKEKTFTQIHLDAALLVPFTDKQRVESSSTCACNRTRRHTMMTRRLIENDLFLLLDLPLHSNLHQGTRNRRATSSKLRTGTCHPFPSLPVQTHRKKRENKRRSKLPQACPHPQSFSLSFCRRRNIKKTERRSHVYLSLIPSYLEIPLSTYVCLALDKGG